MLDFDVCESKLSFVLVKKTDMFLFKNNKLPRILNDVLCTGTILFLQYQRNYQACCWRFGGGYFNLYSEVDRTLRVAPLKFFSCYKGLKGFINNSALKA